MHVGKQLIIPQQDLLDINARCAFEHLHDSLVAWYKVLALITHIMLLHFNCSTSCLEHLPTTFGAIR